MVFLFPAVSPLRSFLVPSPYWSFDGSWRSTVCSRCQVHLSVFQVLVECPDYSVPRYRFFPSLASIPTRERLSFLLSESPTFSFSTLFAFLSVRPYVCSLTRPWIPQRYSTCSAAKYSPNNIYIYIIFIYLFIKLQPSQATAGSARIMPRNELQ